MTGGRVKRVAEFVQGQDAFCLTYGDGLSDVDLTALIKFHKEHGRHATVTVVSPPGRFGAVELQEMLVTRFHEKPKGDGALINGGYFVLSPECIKYIATDETSWEQEPLERLAAEGQLAAYRHSGFWQAMDTLRDKNYLESLWQKREAPWKIWK